MDAMTMTATKAATKASFGHGGDAVSWAGHGVGSGLHASAWSNNAPATMHVQEYTGGAKSVAATNASASVSSHHNIVATAGPTPAVVPHSSWWTGGAYPADVPASSWWARPMGK